jgi:hypothetical protein
VRYEDADAFLYAANIGTRLVEVAARHPAAGCEWLHVDFGPELKPFYFDACGFRPTPAGLIHLASLGDS